VGQTPDNTASIGKITVGGVLSAVIIAGAADPMSTVSKISSITAKAGAFDVQVIAKEIGPVTIAGEKLPLNKGANNDDNRLFGSLSFNEV
jgi:hypothetical protein